MFNLINTAPTKFSPERAREWWEAAGRPVFWFNTIDFPCGTILCAETGVVIYEPVVLGARGRTHVEPSMLDWSQATWG